MPRPGPRNLITDVAGIRVGNASDSRLKSGVTAIVCDWPTVAGVQILGGAPGTRETDLLDPHNLVEHVHAITLSGGSAFGLDAASGVVAWLREHGIGFDVRGTPVPIVPGAILADLHNGGDKDWGRYGPYRELGFEAAATAALDFAIGSTGAGTGALTAGVKGGLGSASVVLPNGISIGALAAINPVGSVTVGQTRHFWAAPFEIGDEFGGLGLPSPLPADAQRVRLKYRDTEPARTHTTIAVVATDAVLTSAGAKRLAMSAHDGFARAIWPAHTPFDGDLVFALATGASGIVPMADQAIDFYAHSASTMARAIARGVFLATAEDGDIMPAWSSLHG
ncbi:MAG: P1 family peptidase [Rhizobiaceae bacterium]|nr:P1 family peptidase [Rhizobiaceae bacterium]